MPFYVSAYLFDNTPSHLKSYHTSQHCGKLARRPAKAIKDPEALGLNLCRHCAKYDALIAEIHRRTGGRFK